MTQQLFTDLGPQLLEYKNANALQRQILLTKAKESVNSLSKETPDVATAIAKYTTLAYAESLVNYADVLRRMENQQFFDILIDFYKMPMEGDFAPLKDIFEFGPIPGQMRLKCPIADVKTADWELFRKAQQAHLVTIKKDHIFDLNQLDINNPPKDALYPILIQMGGKLQNEAVDRICVNAEGQYRFAKRFGSFLLPGGGMVEISDKAGVLAKLHKMVEEFYEEEQANLYINAADLYNADTYKKEDFVAVLDKVFAGKNARAIYTENLEDMKDPLDSNAPNATILAEIISVIDESIEIEKALKTAADSSVKFQEDAVKRLKDKGADTTDAEAALKKDKEKEVAAQNRLKSLAALRAEIQLETFKKTPLFVESLAYVEANTKMFDIQQFLDTRTLAASNTSHSFLMTGQPLEEWLKAKFNGKEGQFGDDIAGSEIERLTLAQVFANFRKVKFSHMLIALANQIECLNNGTLKLDKGWNEDQFSAAVEVFNAEATKLFDANAALMVRDVAVIVTNAVDTSVTSKPSDVPVEPKQLDVPVEPKQSDVPNVSEQSDVPVVEETAEQKLWKDADAELQKTISALPRVKRKALAVEFDKLSKVLKDSATTPEAKTKAYEDFTKKGTEILEGKQYSAVLKAVLTVVAVVLATVLAAAVGFGIGFLAGAWTGPGAFVTGLLAAQVAAVSVVAAAGTAGLVTGGVVGYGFFAPKADSKEVAAIKHYAEVTEAIAGPKA